MHPRTLAALTALLVAPVAPAADYTWVTPTGTNNWNVGSNWSGGVIPTATDNATIGTAGTYTVTLNDFRSITNLTLNNSAATLAQTTGTLSGNLTVGGAFNLSAGRYQLTVSGAANALTVNGSMTAAAGTTFTWTGGRVTGTGTFTLNGTTALTGTGDRQLESLLTVGSGGTFTVGGGTVQATTTGRINVQANGVIEATGGGTPLASFNGTLTSAGTVRASGGTASTIQWVVNNTGAIDVQTGSSLTLQNGGTLSGTNGGAGTLRLALGTFTTPTGTTLANSGVLTVDGGTLTTTGTGAITSTGTVNLASGTLAPATGGSVTLGGTFAWTGGTLGGAGTTTLTGTGTTAGVGAKFLAGVLTIGSGGTLNLTGGNVATTATAGITVLAGGVLDIRTEGAVLGQSGTLSNAGLVKKSTGTANAQLELAIVNSGTFDVQSGTVSISGGLTAGTVMNTGTLTMADGSRIGGSIGGLTITNNSGGLMRGPALGTGTYGTTQGTRQYTFNTGSTLAPGGTVSAGRLILNGNLTMASGSTYHQSLNGGTVTTGFDRVEVNGTVNLGGATLAGDSTGFNRTRPADHVLD